MRRVFTIWTAGELTVEEEEKLIEALTILGIDHTFTVEVTVEQHLMEG
jgi:hypothetical protein